MQTKSRSAVWLLILGLLFTHALAVTTQAQETEGRYLSVRGVGSVEVIPDKATIAFRLSALRDTAAAAQGANAANLVAMESVLKELGIDLRDVKTRGVTLREEWEYTNNERIFRGYRAEQTVAVTVNDITHVGSVLDRVIQASGAHVDGVEFGLKDRTQAEQEALRQAYAHAASRARVLAEMAGITLGAPSHIVDESAVVAAKSVAMDQTMLRAVAAFESTTPVYAGTIQVEARVLLQFDY